MVGDMALPTTLSTERLALILGEEKMRAVWLRYRDMRIKERREIIAVRFYEANKEDLSEYLKNQITLDELSKKWGCSPSTAAKRIAEMSLVEAQEKSE